MPRARPSKPWPQSETNESTPHMGGRRLPTRSPARKWRLYLVWEEETCLGQRVLHLPFSHLEYQQRGGRASSFVRENVLIPKSSHFPFFPIKALQIPGSALERLGALSCVEVLPERGENTRRVCLENYQLQPHMQGYFGGGGDCCLDLLPPHTHFGQVSPLWASIFHYV